MSTSCVWLTTSARFAKHLIRPRADERHGALSKMPHELEPPIHVSLSLSTTLSENDTDDGCGCCTGFAATFPPRHWTIDMPAGATAAAEAVASHSRATLHVIPNAQSSSSPASLALRLAPRCDGATIERRRSQLARTDAASSIAVWCMHCGSAAAALIETRKAADHGRWDLGL